ncbi:GNAT family N-acetyltransferase [Spirosoma sp.]|uniref:GNAT family N-acetyltransferase n=1 Tax=Spirosoma sp. TaxID=1899569 RepID=UPI003B3BB449
MIEYSIQLHTNFQSSTIPEFGQSGFFFNNLEHLRHQHSGSFHLLTAQNQRTGLAEARCAFFVDAGKAISPVAAPFGSVEFTETLPEPVLDTFLHALSNAIRSIGTSTTFRLTHYPCCYAPEQTALLRKKLPKYGFQLTRTDQTFYLPVDAGMFGQLIAPAERRRLRKCREAGFQFQHWTSPNITDVVNFVQDTRRQQGYQLTICPKNLTNLLHRFPDQFLVFTVYDGLKLAALSIAIRVREDILYSFLPASHPDYRTFSPTVMLVDGLYTFCQKEAIRLLDLGTSLDGNNQPKSSLRRFKRNLGALESPKFVFEKHF